MPRRKDYIVVQSPPGADQMGARAQGPDPVRFGTVSVLALLDWGDALHNPGTIESVAREFLGVAHLDDVQRASDWYRGPVTVPIPGREPLRGWIGITHSRVIIHAPLTDLHPPADFHAFREYREHLEEGIRTDLATRIQRCKVSSNKELREYLAYLDRLPFVYVYPVIRLDRDSALYRSEFPQGTEVSFPGDGGEHIPFNVATSTFFLGLRVRPWPRRDRVVFLRVSGASMLTGPCPDPLFQRLTDIVYFSGLYPMTQAVRDQAKKDSNYSPPLIQEGFEATVVESNIQALLKRLDREEASLLTNLTFFIVALTVILIVVTAVLAYPKIH